MQTVCLQGLWSGQKGSAAQVDGIFEHQEEVKMAY